MRRTEPAYRAFRRFSTLLFSLLSMSLLLPGSLVAQDGVFGASAGKPPAGELQPDSPVNATLYLRKGRASVIPYTFTVSPEAFAVRFQLSEVTADLDLLIRDARGNLLYYSEEGDYNETLFVSRLSNPPLFPGEYTVEVAYQLPTLPRRGGATMMEVPFRLTMTTVRAQASVELQPQTPHRSTLRPETGMARFFEVSVPPEAKALRIDISQTDGDLDLFVSRGTSGALPMEADYVSQSLLSREHLLITPESNPPLESGDYTITVLDQIGSQYETPFTIEVRFERRPAPWLRQLPGTVGGSDLQGRAEFQGRADFEGRAEAGDLSLGRSLPATVELSTGSGNLGSGVLVSPRGHILTNWHVIRGPGGDPDKVIYVAVTVETGRPPREAFRARVVDYRKDRDLALIKVAGDLYGDAIPGDYHFPWLPIGEDRDLAPGDSIGLIGFPRLGGTGSRVSVTYTRGIVSGFEERPYGRVIKTDADANQGNSGGAAVNAAGALVGIPSQVVGLEWGHLGYVQPVSAIPPAWRRIISDAAE